MRIYGVDFTSAPRQRKPIAVAVAEARDEQLLVSEIEELVDFPVFERLLQRPGPWVGGFDFPFGLSREAVTDLGWPLEWSPLMSHFRSLERVAFKRTLDEYRQTRPAGSRYASRAGDTASGAHPSVKLVNPPVGFMFFEGAPRLAAAGVNVPGLRTTCDTRVALEAYPGFFVRRQLGILASYKSDRVLHHTPARRRVREEILAALQKGLLLGVKVRLIGDVERRVIEDGSGDSIDAVICAAQAHWGWVRRESNYGLPPTLDPLEGWIVTA